MVRGEYFWVLVIAMGLLGSWRIHVRLRPIVAADPTLAEGARTLVRTMVALVVILPTVNGCLQYFGGFSEDPGWWATNDLGNPYALAAFLFQVIFMIVVLWWTWLANGPARLLKYQAAFSTAQNPMMLGARGLRWFLTLVPLVFMTVRVIQLLKHSGH